MSTPIAAPIRKRSWRRKLLFLCAGLFILLIALYFIVTSSAFFKGVILPRASKAVGGQITVEDASISPFSQVHLRQLKVQAGTEPLLQANEVRLRYSLASILRGTLKVDEITITSPVVQVIENADGTSNLDPFLKQEAKPSDSKKASAPSGKPPQIDLKNFALNDAIVRHVKQNKDGSRESIELSGVNITLDQLKNGQAGKITLAANSKLTGPTNDLLEAKIQGNIEFTLGADLTPQLLKAKVEQEVLKADGSLRDFAGHRTTFTSDVTSTEVKEFALRFTQRDKLLGELKASGPLDLAKKEGRLKLEVASIDRNVLNLAGAPMGIDFGTTTLDSTTEISLTQGGSLITATSRFNAVQFSVTQKGQTTPPLDVHLACNVAINTAGQTAEVQAFTLDGTQNQKPFLHGALSKPMTIAWGKQAAPAGDAALEVAVTDFDLPAWKPLIGDKISSGRLAAQINLVSQQGGKLLKLGLQSQIANLSATFGEKPLTEAALKLTLDGQLSDFKKVVLSEYRIEMTQQTQPALTIAGSAAYDGSVFNLQTRLDAVLSRLTGAGPSTSLGASVKLDGSFTNQVLDLRQLQLALAPTARAPKNDLSCVGRIDLSTPGTTKGGLTIRSDALDLTQLYNAFGGDKRAAAPAGTPVSSAPGSSGKTEPEPVTLPLQFTLDAKLGQVYLREIAISNCQTTAKVEGGRVRLDPCQLTLNGAPVSASGDVNLGVKGFTYVLSLVMDRVPLEPIANTFSPETHGQFQGSILANAQIKGAGTTDESLRKNLGGQLSFTFTNANIQLAGSKARMLIVPIATLLQVSEITQTPLNWVDARVELGGGNIKLSQVGLQSSAFEARTQGVIPLAEVLTNSPLNLPVEFSLRRSLAEKARLLPANTPPDAAYATLPKFITVKGTIGEPKSDLNKLALAGLLINPGLGVAEKLGANVGGKTGESLKSLGNLLTGQNPATTNQAKTNATPKANPLDIFKKK